MSYTAPYTTLLSRVEAAAKDALECEVAQEVKDIMKEQTGYQVYSYDASPMAMATRRVDDGGLGDQRNMRSDVQGDGAGTYTLTVENTAPFQFPMGGGTALSDVVEKGLKAYNQPYPRPFVAATQTQAVSSGRAYQALKNGLRRKGRRIPQTMWGPDTVRVSQFDRIFT